MLILDTRIAPFDQAAVRDALGQVATPGAAAREALASAGLPDAFDVQVWNTQDPAVAELCWQPPSSRPWPPVRRWSRPGRTTSSRRLGPDWDWRRIRSPVAADETSTAFVVGGREDWPQAFWLALAQAVAADVLASGPLDSPAQVVVRRTLFRALP